jgi:uncharacterized protein (DUF302 family)
MKVDHEQNRRHFMKQIVYPYLICFLPRIKNNELMKPNGMIIRESRYAVKETIDRLVNFLEQHGATLYSRINQQSEVQKAGIEILPLEFILFGNPKVGGQVMLENPLAALDLPLKIIAWEDKDHKVWYAFNEASYLGERYSLPQTLAGTLDLDAVTTKALAS